MLLGIDVGNTNIVLGVFQDDTLLNHWRIRTERDMTGDELGLLSTICSYRNNLRQRA